MLFNIIAWGMSWVSVRTVLTELDAGQVGAMRYLIASAVMLPVWLYRGRPLPDRSDLGLVALLGLFGFCFYNLGINFGEKTVDAGTGSLLISFQPIIVIIIGVLLRRETVSLVSWIGILISMAGVIMTAIGGSAGLILNFGTILILGAALSSAIQTLIKITMHGLAGPTKVQGKDYGLVPMPPMGLDDQQLADVLTYVRSAFGNKAAAVKVEEVKAVRDATKGRTAPWTAVELGK